MKSMKKIHLILTGLLLFGLIACSDDDDNSDSHKVGSAVQFDASISEMSKLKTADGLWTSGDEIGVYMMRSGTTLVVNNARNSQYTADASGRLSPVADPIYYPADESKNVDFVAYYPYKEVSNFLYDVNLKDQSQQSKIDLLYSNNALDINNGVTSVDLNFSHKLTKLIFNISVGQGLPASSLNNMKVNINGLNTAADFNLAIGRMSNIRTKEIITASTAPDGTVSQAIVLPESDVLYNLEFVLSNNTSFEWKTTVPVSFTEGKIYSFDVTVGTSQIEISEGSISDWLGTGDDPTLGNGKPVVVAKYSVGDVYPKEGTPTGIVYEISNGGKNGKVVSLQEKQARWGDNTKDESADGVLLIRDADNGKDATKNLIAKRKNAANFANDYTVFYWLYNSLNGADENGAWYVPSKNELKELYAAISGLTYDEIENSWTDGAAMPEFDSTASQNARTAFNTKVTNAGGTAFNFYGQYWAVTEISSNVVWSVHFQTSVLQNSKSKGDAYGRLRPILAF